MEKRRYSDRPPRDEYVLTEAGRDFLPVLFAIGAWGRKYRNGGKVTRFFDAETGTEIDPLTIDRGTGAPVGTRPIRIVDPDPVGSPLLCNVPDGGPFFERYLMAVAAKC